MAHAHAHINPAMLRWARDRVGLGVNEAATAAGVKPDRFQLQEEGQAQPTFRQAQVRAQALHAPFAFFFLSEAPAEDLPLPDLRTIGGALADKPSVNLVETVRHALQRQAWFVEYQQEQGAEPLPFVGRFTTASNPVQVAQDIRAVLGVDVEDELAQRFHVSRFVVIRRTLDLGLVDRDTYTTFYRAELDAFQAEGSGGGSFYRNAGAKNSARFARAVIAEAFSGRLLLRDAGRLLGVQPARVQAGMLNPRG